ncbi:MAG: c-type cytochrome domain-containing protein [Pseudobdellovibrio sp.]
MNLLKKSTVKSLGLVAFSFSLVLSYQNCSKPSVNMASLSSSSSLSASDALEQKALTVLVTRCSSCHSADLKTAGIDVMNINEMLALGVIVPGEPSLSLVFTQIQGGQMPPSKALNQTEIQAVYSWIADGLKPGTPVGPLPPVPVDVLEAKYASIYKFILAPKCLGCHGANSGNGVSFSTYAATMNTVQKTLPMSSALYTSVATRKTMPRGAAGSITASESKTISDWITAGALNN